MTKFSACIDYVLGNEGSEYTDDPNDRGGCTKYGLTLKDCLEASWLGIRSCEDLKQLDVRQAKSVYYALYWKFGEILDVRVATKMFDMYVNMGPSANFLFQRAVNSSGGSILVDGVVGPATKTAINKIDPEVYLQELVNQSLSYYEKIIKHRPSQKVFLNGWNNRAKRLPNGN